MGIVSNYGSVITVENDGDEDVSLDLGGMKDVLLSPETALRLAAKLTLVACEILEDEK